MGVTSELRARLYCADCRNCKLQVWEEDDKLDDLTKRGYVVQDKPSKAFYLVRCSWTKDTVFQPHKLIKCEGKQTFNE